MLIVEPPSARYEINYASPYEEHLLERISLLENYLGRLTERFEKILDLMMRQAQTAYLDHTLLESLIAALSDSGVVDSRNVSAIWQMKRNMDSSQRERAEKHERIKHKILAQHKDGNDKRFAAQIEKALARIEEGRLARGVKGLEKALLLSPSNGALLFLVGRHYYFANKQTLARDYLAQSLLHDPQNGLACLLLGLLCGDAGEVEHGKTLLGMAAKLLEPNFAAHYSLGRLLAAEGDWTAALEAFKRAQSVSAGKGEGTFAIGCAYYALNRLKLAGRFMQKAVDDDEDYAEAWYWLGLLNQRSGQREEAAKCFQAAAEANKEHPLYREAVRLKNAPLEPLPFDMPKRSKRLITGGDKRLAAFLKKEIAEMCRAYPLKSENKGA
jgi:tetratricopeptide (TPR) repeat protein